MSYNNMVVPDTPGDVGEYGLNRSAYPKMYKGHSLSILFNDAGITDDDRLLIHIHLSCSDCGKEACFRGRLSPDASDCPAGYANAAKLAVFGEFTDKI